MDYIHKTSTIGFLGSSYNSKCKGILEDGAIEIEQPKEWCKNLVCVVDNGEFGASAFVRDESDFGRCTNPNDIRPTRWFIWNKVESYND